MYYMTKSNIKTERNERTAYGIASLNGNCAEILFTDISSDISLVRSIVEKCNKYDAAPEHIADIVYDCIG